MSFIFDTFKTEQDARSFIARVQERYHGMGCQLFMDSDEAHKNDPFPWVQIPPVVHVDRLEDLDSDSALKEERRPRNRARSTARRRRRRPRARGGRLNLRRLGFTSLSVL